MDPHQMLVELCKGLIILHVFGDRLSDVAIATSYIGKISVFG